MWIWQLPTYNIQLRTLCVKGIRYKMLGKVLIPPSLHWAPKKSSFIFMYKNYKWTDKIFVKTRKTSFSGNFWKFMVPPDWLGRFFRKLGFITYSYLTSCKTQKGLINQFYNFALKTNGQTSTATGHFCLQISNVHPHMQPLYTHICKRYIYIHDIWKENRNIHFKQKQNFKIFWEINVIF